MKHVGLKIMTPQCNLCQLVDNVQKYSFPPRFQLGYRQHSSQKVPFITGFVTQNSSRIEERERKRKRWPLRDKNLKNVHLGRVWNCVVRLEGRCHFFNLLLSWELKMFKAPCHRMNENDKNGVIHPRLFELENIRYIENFVTFSLPFFKEMAISSWFRWYGNYEIFYSTIPVIKDSHRK